MKKSFRLFLISFIFLSVISQMNSVNSDGEEKIRNESFWNSDLFVVTDTDPYYAILASSYACYYPNNSSSICKPLLLNPTVKLNNQHHRFICNFSDNPYITIIGGNVTTSFETISYYGSPASVSLLIASQYYHSNQAILLPYGNTNDYTHALYASPLSSYLHIPLLIYDNNSDQINRFITDNNIEKLYIIGNIRGDLFDVNSSLLLPDEYAITHFLLQTIKERFGSINYITLTNPKDIEEKYIHTTTIEKQKREIEHIQFTIAGKSIVFKGESSLIHNITIPSGIYHLQCEINYTSHLPNLFVNNTKDPIVFGILKNPSGSVVGYSQSSSYDIGKIYIDTLITECPGIYTLTLSVYHGMKGGFFSTRGFSIVQGSIDIVVQYDQLETSHCPKIKSLSSLAPYLTNVHRGIIIANESFSLTSNNYDYKAVGTSTGPWYEENLHPFTNSIVNRTVQCIDDYIDIFDQYELRSTYLNGPAWLAILSDTTMIPMFYYSPSQSGLDEKGLASDNPYSLNESLSIGRIIGYSSVDVSNLLCRTFFYRTLCEHDPDPLWQDSFHFMYGEGFGETGGWFHQIPYAREIQQYGFTTRVFGDLQNSRQYAENHDVFVGANYNEYLGHGDWFWFVPSLYGCNMFEQAFDVTHLKDWKFDKPSIFLTSACLMGRVDGISPRNNIGITLLHAGCNAFLGATRETGQEAGLEIVENSLIRNDTSIGEALREEKRVDKIGPTYFVRTLFGDPAFNPYEPNNGFSIAMFDI